VPRSTSTISLYTFSLLCSSPLRDVTRPRVLLQRYPMRRPEVGGLFLRKETGHLLFPYSDMKRHFYFCRPPRCRYFYRLQNSLAGISMPRSWARFTDPKFEATYNMDIAHVFKEFHLFPPLLSVAHRSSNFPYSSSNRPARDSASYIQLDSKLSLDCQSAFVSSLALRCDSYLPVSPCFRVLSSARRIQSRRFRSDFQF